jgi:hypothetical protein
MAGSSESGLRSAPSALAIVALVALIFSRRIPIEQSAPESA